MPFAADDALVCAYGQPPKAPGTVLTGVLRLGPAEAERVAAEVNSASAAQPDACTADVGVPIVLRAGGKGRAVTLTLQPYACGVMTNGTATRAGKTQFVRDLRDRAVATSACPRRIPSAGLAGPGFFAADPGPTILPTATVRLLLCGYRDSLPARQDSGWDAAVEGPDVRSLVDRVNAARPAPGVCSTEGNAPRVLATAVAPDRVKRVVVEIGNCRAFFDGARSVHDQAAAEQLLRLAQQR